MRFSESSNDERHFLFFEDFEDERFDEFVELVLKALSASVIDCLHAPYADLLTIDFEQHQLTLTSGSLEGCFLTMEKKESYLVEYITRACEKKFAALNNGDVIHRGS